MVDPLAQPRILLLALLALVLSVTPASAAAARSSGRTTSGLSSAAVVRAFHALGVKLVAETAGNSSQPVTVLTAVVPRKLTHAKPWAVEVFVYPDRLAAVQAFDAGDAGWRNDGLAAAHANNLIVTVVPKGQVIGSYGPPFAMPLLVRHALDALGNTAG
jgi:hypothetical protein